MTERKKLVNRVGQLRQRAATRAPQADRDRNQDQTTERVRALEGRVAHLERMLEGFQDSVHRESSRLEGRIDELQAQLDPATMGAAIADDARSRGL